MTANGKAGLNPYDEVPYPNFAYSATHPDSLATVATLLGVEPAPVDHCRVLELGCASGGNLIPMAQGLPHSEFIGVDFSAHQIASGQRAAAALGLKNVTLWHMNILDVLSADLGQFDYIVAHGIFSWVPRDVQEAILEICHQHLAPYGIAYVSYNVYPGWHMMGAIREMMLYHTRDVTEPPLRAAQARALLDFLAQSIPADGSPHSSLLSTYSSFLKRETEHIHGSPDAYLLHDELEEINAPIYFYQFAERAACHGLQYLSEVELSSVMPANFPPEVSANLFKLARDVVEMEQYMDFLRNRTFRKTLLCHQSIPVNRTLKANRVMGMHIASRARPVSAQPDLNSAGVEKFTSSSDGATFTTDHPVTKTAMTLLSEIWPHAMFFDTLLDTARARLNAINPSQPDADTRALDAHTLAANLLKGHAYSANLVELPG